MSVCRTSAHQHLVLLLGTFFGDLADKVGRRRVLSLAVFGMICGLAWVFVTCRYSPQTILLV